jgi:psiF repeat
MSMLKAVIAGALLAGAVAAAAPSSFAAPGQHFAQATPQATTPQATSPESTTPQRTTRRGKSSGKPLTAQQNRMKTCAGQWSSEKATTGVKGRAAYRKFMSQCLKKPAA